MNDLAQKISEDFKEKEYRHSYLDEFLDAWIATQIKVLREQRGWSQKDLAEKANMLQPRISALENVNYSSWSVNTLRKLAQAFDLTLRISFESFGDRTKDFDQFSREYLERPSFDDDPVFSSVQRSSLQESRALVEGWRSEPQKVISIANRLQGGQPQPTGGGTIDGIVRSKLMDEIEMGGPIYGTAISQQG